jgi:hypothetical protein
MAFGIELAEKRGGWVPLDGDAQRGGAGGAGQPERLDLLNDQPELVL